MRSVLVSWVAVFSLAPLNTAALANLPFAILLTAFFFMTLAFMDGLVAFFIDLADFITDFMADFIGRAIVRR